MIRTKLTQSVALGVQKGMTLLKENSMVLIVGAVLCLMCSFGYAEGSGTDLLAGALDGDVKKTLGSGAMFWKVFILADITIATAAAVKTKNPMVFAGVFGVCFIPAILLRMLVFGGV